MPTKPVKGQRGGKGFENNPQNINRAGGPPKTHWWSQLYIDELARESTVRKEMLKRESVVQAVVEKAEAGDMSAVKEIGDRVVGKAPQAIGTLDDDGAFQPQNIGVVFLDP